MLYSGSVQQTFNLVVEPKCSKTDWKIEKFENVIPIFVCEIRSTGLGKKIEFLMSVNTSQPPILVLRTFSVETDFNYVRLQGEVKQHTEESEESPNFEQFVFVYETRFEKEVVDFVGLESCRLEIRSFEINLK